MRNTQSLETGMRCALFEHTFKIVLIWCSICPIFWHQFATYIFTQICFLLSLSHHHYYLLHWFPPPCNPGQAVLGLDKLESKSEVRGSVDLLDEKARKPVGGKMEVVARLREPLSGEIIAVILWEILRQTNAQHHRGNCLKTAKFTKIQSTSW